MKYLAYLLFPGIICLIFGGYFKDMTIFLIGEFCLVFGSIGAVFLARNLRIKKLEYDFRKMLKKRFQRWEK